MSDTIAKNPFAPPRAHVEDQSTAPAEMVTATRASRFLAVLVDMSPVFVLAVIAGIVAAVAMPGLFKGDFGSGFAAMGLFFFVFGIVSIAWLVWNIVLLYRYGQTVGKKALGIRVVRMDGSRVSFARFVFLRWLAIAFIGGVVGGICGALHIRYIGNMVSLVDCLMIFGAAHRCLHDYLADTKVVTAASSPYATLEGASRG